MDEHDEPAGRGPLPPVCPAAAGPLTVTVDGLRLAARLYQPPATPRGALLVCHGAGSCKENHALMGEQAAAAGMAALLFDFRGHGESEGFMGPDAWHDVLAAAGALRRASGAPWVAGRGTSMGGCWLLLAARAQPAAFAALSLLCPADAASLLAGLDTFEWGPAREEPSACPPARFDVPGLRRSLPDVDLIEAARGMPRVLLAHAKDDDVVSFAHSERLAAVLAPPTRFIALQRGGHHGPGRSAEVARATIAWSLEHGAAGTQRRP